MPKLKPYRVREALPDCDRNSRKFSMKFYLMFTVLEEFYFNSMVF